MEGRQARLREESERSIPARGGRLSSRRGDGWDWRCVGLPRG